MKDFLELVKNAKGELITIAARPAMGKSSLAIDIINSMEAAGDVLYFNLESSVRQLIGRIHRDNVYIIDIPGVSTDIIKSISDIIGKHNLSLVVVDYLQLVNFDDNNGWFKKESDIVKLLRNIATKYNIPVVLISQLDRSVDVREDKRPTISDINPILKIDSNIIVSLYCEYRYTKLFNPDVENKNLIDTELIYFKNNNQLDQLDTVKIIYDKSKCSFVID